MRALHHETWPFDMKDETDTYKYTRRVKLTTYSATRWNVLEFDIRCTRPPRQACVGSLRKENVNASTSQMQTERCGLEHTHRCNIPPSESLLYDGSNIRKAFFIFKSGKYPTSKNLVKFLLGSVLNIRKLKHSANKVSDDGQGRIYAT